MPLGKFLVSPPTYGINAPAVPFDLRYPAYIRITDITDDGRFDPAGRASVRSLLADNYRLEQGDIVLARTGASTGKSYMYNPKDGELVYAGFLIRIHPDIEKLSPRYVRFLLQTESYWDWIRTHSMRSGQPGINGQQYASLPIPIPSSKEEQEAIATALSDADALIESLEALIAKKRAIKQGAMQDLLSGRKRLPGFSGEWQSKTLGSLGTFRGGNGFPIRFQGRNTGKYPYFKVSDMSLEGNEMCLTSANNYIDEIGRQRLSSFVFPTNTIVFAKVGAAIFLERKRSIGQPSCLDNNIAGYWISDPETDYRYVLHCLQNCRLGDLVNTTALPSLNGHVLESIKMTFPPTRDEQLSIAEALSDIDDEVFAVTKKLRKARLIKQGMMQELLTGRVRLV